MLKSTCPDSMSSTNILVLSAIGIGAVHTDNITNASKHDMMRVPCRVVLALGQLAELNLIKKLE